MTPSRVTREDARDRLVARVAALIDRLADGGRDDAARDALLAELFAWQREHVETIARIAAAGHATGMTGVAVPTDVFRFARVAAHAPEQDVRVFRTSGTTSGARGAHHLRDLSLYARAARAAARHALFPDVQRMRLIVLAPTEIDAPDSSLSYMFARFLEWFGARESRVAWRDGRPDVDALVQALDQAERARVPVALCGTSLAFVHAEEALGARRFQLAAGSRLLHTGGFKGRARAVAPDALLAQLAMRYGIDRACVVQEYGMTELSSQCYQTTLRDAMHPAAARGLPDAREEVARSFWAPGWVHTMVVDPETLTPLPVGATGLLRIDDLANVDTACAVQTSDLARATDTGFALLGRAPGATPRGCSLAVDAVRGASS